MVLASFVPILVSLFPPRGSRAEHGVTSRVRQLPGTVFTNGINSVAWDALCRTTLGCVALFSPSRSGAQGRNTECN